MVLITKKYGLAKAAIYRQSTAPSRQDVLWYDTTNDILRYFNQSVSIWQPLRRLQMSGDITIGTPTAHELSLIIGLSAAVAGAGFKVSIKNTNTTEVFLVESDGTDWCYVGLGKASVGGITDFDGNLYHETIINGLTWLLEPLKTTHFADGTPIPNLISQQDWWTNNGNGYWDPSNQGAYCWYLNDISYKTPYGALYNFYAVKNVKGFIAGYHVPTKTELETLLGINLIQAGWLGLYSGYRDVWDPSNEFGCSGMSHDSVTWSSTFKEPPSPSGYYFGWELWQHYDGTYGFSSGMDSTRRLRVGCNIHLVKD